jgi:hypothetical protein
VTRPLNLNLDFDLDLVLDRPSYRAVCTTPDALYEPVKGRGEVQAHVQVQDQERRAHASVARISR